MFVLTDKEDEDEEEGGGGEDESEAEGFAHLLIPIGDPHLARRENRM